MPYQYDYYKLQNLQTMVSRVLKDRNCVRLGDEMLVRIPEVKGQIYFKEESNGNRTVEFIYKRWYDKETRQSRNQKKAIGVIMPDFPMAMYPNEHYDEFFDIETGEPKVLLNEPEIPAEEEESGDKSKAKEPMKTKSGEKTDNPKEPGNPPKDEETKKQETADTEENKRAKEKEERDRNLDKFLREMEETAAEFRRQDLERKIQADEDQRRKELYGEEAFAEIEQREAEKRLMAMFDKHHTKKQDEVNGPETGDGNEMTEEDNLQEAYREYEEHMERIAVLFKILEGIKNSIHDRTRKQPDGIINRYKAQKINRILAEIRDTYKDTNYADLLELIEEPRKEEQDRETVLTGMTYSDAEMVLEHYAAITKYIKIKKPENSKT